MTVRVGVELLGIRTLRDEMAMSGQFHYRACDPQRFVAVHAGSLRVIRGCFRTLLDRVHVGRTNWRP